MSERVDALLKKQMAAIEKVERDFAQYSAEREALVVAAREFVAKLALVQPHIESLQTFAWIHGQRYGGPTWKDELVALRRALEACNND